MRRFFCDQEDEKYLSETPFPKPHDQRNSWFTMENSSLSANRDAVASLAKEAAAKVFNKKSNIKSKKLPTVSKTPMAAVDPTP